MDNTLISIIVPAYNEHGSIGPLYNEINRTMNQGHLDYELIIVDDGSTDSTREKIETITATDSRVKGIHLARNFGHQYALLAGLEEATGDAVVTIDADLQQPPATILNMVEQWRQGFQIVHGVRQDHPKTSLYKKTTSKWFYRIFSFLCRIPMEPGMLDFRLMDRKVVEAVLSLNETDFFLRGIAAWIGFKQTKVPFQSQLRIHGKTKYSNRKMVSFAVRGITSFSTFPLRLATYLGSLMTLFSIGYGTYVGIRHFFWEHPQPGYASTILLIAFLMGVQFLLIGVLGEYVARIHVEVKKRPRYIVAAKSQPADQTTARVKKGGNGCA